jgi:hypothetical protein
MANRKALITKDHLNCPACNEDYSKTNLVERFERTGNISHLVFICDCKQKLSLRLMVNGWLKIYDITEINERKNRRDRELRKLKRNATNN